MKKTVKTAMTAAMFAASLGMAAGTASASQTGDYQAVPLEELITATSTETICVYGPPEVMESLFGRQTTSESFTETVTETTLALSGTVTLPVTTTNFDVLSEDGVAPIVTDDPLETAGDVPVRVDDLNSDGSFDSRDLTLLKRFLLDPDSVSQQYPSLKYDADFDYNGRIDTQDVIQMLLRLTGMPEWKKEDPAVTTTTVSETVLPSTETTIFTEELPQPAYGPIGWYDSE